MTPRTSRFFFLFTLSVLSLSFLLACPKQPSSQPNTESAALAEWKLTMVRGEQSRDSHSYQYKCSVSNGKFSYFGPYGKCVRGRCPHKAAHLSLNNKQVNKVVKLLSQKVFQEDFKEVHPTKFTGTMITINFSHELKEQTKTIQIQGMRRSWNKSDKKAQAAILGKKAKTIVASFQDLQHLCTTFAKVKDSTFL